MLDIPQNHIEWANKQPLFFVATAPLNNEGLINCSPKGGDCFLLDSSTFIYADYTGSGVETIAHIQENKRICVMFCSFEKAPKILRFHGIGSYINQESEEFNKYKKLLPYYDTIRAYIKVDIKRFDKACGYGVPIYNFVSHRDTLLKWADAKDDKGIKDYQIEKNSKSIDGLPGL